MRVRSRSRLVSIGMLALAVVLALPAAAMSDDDEAQTVLEVEFLGEVVLPVLLELRDRG